MKFTGWIHAKGWLMAVPLFFCSLTNGQSIRYSNFYDSNLGAELLKEAVMLDDGSLLIIGNTSNATGGGYARSFNIVVSEQGDLEYSWVREAVQTHIDPKAVVRSNSGGSIYEAGYVNYASPGTSYSDYYLAKLDETGDTIFTKVIERPDTSDYLLDIVQTRPNKLLLIGWTYNDNVAVSGGSELMFITVDTLGNELNRVIWGGGNTDYVNAACVKGENGSVLMTGYTLSFGAGNGKTWVLETDSIGNVQWYQIYSDISTQGDGGLGISRMEYDGNFLVTGGYNLPTESNAFMLKIDASGNEIWKKKYLIPDYQGLYDGEELEDGTIVAAGQTTNTNDDSQAGWLIKTDSEGEMLWSRTYNPSSLVDFIRFMLVMPNGDIVMLGDGRAPGETNQDGWVLRVDSEGCLVEDCSVGVEELEQTELVDVWPNPVGDILNIEKSDPPGSINVTVYDMRGRVVTSPNPSLQGGEPLRMDVSAWPPGLYILRGTDSEGRSFAVKVVKE